MCRVGLWGGLGDVEAGRPGCCCGPVARMLMPPGLRAGGKAVGLATERGVRT